MEERKYYCCLGVLVNNIQESTVLIKKPTRKERFRWWLRNKKSQIRAGIKLLFFGIWPEYE